LTDNRSFPSAIALLAMGLSATMAAALAAPAHAAPGAAPATVLDHTLDVQIDWGRRLSSTQTWTVRIDDPAACAAGLFAPTGLSGAMDGDALVLEDLLIVPATAQKGDVYTLTQTTRLDGGFHSGIFSSAPDLPVEKAKVTISAKSNAQLTVWADPKGDPDWSDRGPTASITWVDVPADDPARVVWSIWPDWLKAGEEIERAVDAKMANKNQLGREIASDLKSTNLSELARRVFQQIALTPGATGTYDDARNAAAVVEEGAGTASERAIVLIALLRAAGYEAHPARFRPSGARGAFPITVPSPAMLDQPLVQAKDSKGRILWIDPSSDTVAVPELPSSLLGATVWVPGDLPTTLNNDAVVNGTVIINTTARIDTRGDVTWNASIDASGTGLEWIRKRLASLDEAGQRTALKRLATQARPDLDRFAITSSGVQDPYRDLKLTVSGFDEGVFERFGAGMRGEIAPVLGPAMAAWLPPKIRVQEFVDIAGPTNLLIVANSHPRPAYDADALLDRDARRNGPRLRLQVEAQRPYDETTSTRDAGAARFMAEQAPEGVELLLFPPTSGAVVKSLASEDLSDAERVALETLLWLGVDNERKAAKVLKKAIKTLAIDDIAPTLASWLDEGDERPWILLADIVEEEDEAARVAIMRAMSRYDFGRLAWFEGHALAQSAEPDIATEGLLVQLKHQPLEQPDAEADPDGHARWTEPETLLAGIEEQGRAAGGDVEDRGQLAIADWRLTYGGDAESALNNLPDETPRASALHLTQYAETFPNSFVIERAEALLAEAPSDPVVVGHLATAMSRIGRKDDALRYGLASARLAHDEVGRWMTASDLAMAAGRLSLALEAARRASDIDPTHGPAAEKLHAVATLALNAEAETIARERAGLERPKSWPLSIDELMGLAPPTGLLALLQFHEADVVASPVMLGIRAQLRTEAGLFDEAARDSINLSRLHDKPEGPALAFAATVGRVFGSGSDQLLDQVDNDVARLTRMEYQLLTGDGDPRRDARALTGEPRAEDVLLTAGSPDEAAAKVEGWPADLANARVATPSGYRVNAILSAPKGVSGFSDADRQLALLHINADTELLPPPLALLFTPRTPLLSESKDGVELMRLDGGNLPLYAARKRSDDTTVIGLGFTALAAQRALADFGN
jgi:hypothetical protein